MHPEKEPKNEKTLKELLETAETLEDVIKVLLAKTQNGYIEFANRGKLQTQHLIDAIESNRGDEIADPAIQTAIIRIQRKKKD